jgi:hypothetical protein
MNINGGSWSSGRLLRKNDVMNCQLLFKTYNYVKTTIQLQIAQMSSVTTPSEADWVNYGRATEITPSGTQVVGETWDTLLNLNFTVGEIADSQYVYFRAKITNILNSEAKIAYPSYAISVRHSAATGLEITDIKFDRDPTSSTDKGKISLVYNSTNAGLHVITGSLSNVTCQAELEFSLTSDFSSIITALTTPWKSLSTYNDIQTSFTNVESSTSIISESLPNTGWNFYYARIKLVTIDSSEINGSPVITYSAPILIYNIAPTVSYRSNQVGINYDLNGDYTDAVLVVSESAGKNKIYLVSASGEVVDDSYIKLENGHIIFNGGTWD